MSTRPDDEAYLVTLAFEVMPMQRYCGSCDRVAATAVIGCIDACSGGGYDIRWCRRCILRRRIRVRALMASRVKTAPTG